MASIPTLSRLCPLPPGTLVNGLVNALLPLTLALAAAVAVGHPHWLDGAIAPAEASSVQPLPRAWERWRPHLIVAMLAAMLPAIVAATGLKTWELLS